MNNEDLKQWRVALGYDAPTMAQYLGANVHTYRAWESGSRKPTGSTVKLIEVLRTIEVLTPTIAATFKP